MAKILRPFTTLTVKTTNGRFRHVVVKTVPTQNSITGRIGLAGNSASVSATRAASTTTRGTQFNQP